MKTASYRLTDGRTMTIEYDPDQPCWQCGLPVMEASVGGTAYCPWCDSGSFREGARGDYNHPWRTRYPEEFAAAYPPDADPPKTTFSEPAA